MSEIATDIITIDGIKWKIKDIKHDGEIGLIFIQKVEGQ